ncbi:fatty acid desaturase-domain-containing protein [Spinellus fusiger]|nr:fatty acid desaturase-domain-containing protein [Spinellus fusiger]
MPPLVETANKPPTVPAPHPDYRYPLFLGQWKRSIPYLDDGFAHETMDEPHLKRKQTILHDHPEIEKLYGTDIRTLYVTVAITITQLTLAYYFGRVSKDPLWLFFLVAYFVGGTLSSMLGVVIHEACHCLIMPTKIHNRYVGLLANVTLPVPIAQSFRRYHIEHHTWQGVKGMDPDLPLEWEKKMIQGSTPTKLLWILIYPVMYVVRGAIQQQERNLTPSKWELINLGFTIVTDLIVQRTCGWIGLGYLLLSLWLGYSLHPGAAHFIQEHYTFKDGQETYSYYGVLNFPLMNIGYHNEHHDFQKVPWSRLPQLKTLAHEYYDSLAYHTSWVMVHWHFIFQPTLGPQSRVVRTYNEFKQGRSLLGAMRAWHKQNDMIEPFVK